MPKKAQSYVTLFVEIGLLFTALQKSLWKIPIFGRRWSDLFRHHLNESNSQLVWFCIIMFSKPHWLKIYRVFLNQSEMKSKINLDWLTYAFSCFVLRACARFEFSLAGSTHCPWTCVRCDDNWLKWLLKATSHLSQTIFSQVFVNSFHIVFNFYNYI